MLMLAEVPTTRTDFVSPEVTADPWPHLRALREQGPVVWHETFNRWLVTTDQHVREVVTDFRRFTVGGTPMATLFGDEAFISLDDRRAHDHLRLVWAEPFRKQGLVAYEPLIAGIVEELVGEVETRLRDGENVELIEALCRALPTQVIGAMMGVPRDMLADVIRWSDEMAAGVASYHRDDEGVRRREAAKASLAEYLIAQIEARRARPNGDLICMMANSEIARGLPNAHLVQNVRQLLFAGNESTAKWLAQIFLTYAQRDDVRRELIADPSLVPAANDEVMRWAGVVGTGLRRVTEPTQLAGVAMQPGQDVTVLIAAANRDPARYADPDRFDIHRPHQPNLGFGVGLHFCLGINLAKLEVERVVNAFLARMPDYVVTAPVTYSTLAMRGPHPLIIALDR